MKQPQQEVHSKEELGLLLDATMSEEQWLKEVMAYAHEHGWLASHFRPAPSRKGWRTPMQGDIGFPDLVLARGGVVVLAELKALGGGGLVTTYQRRWLDAAGGYLWTPAQREEMHQLLEGE